MQTANWDLLKLEKLGVTQLTNDIYDAKIWKAESESANDTAKPWLIIFVTDILSDNPYSRFGPMNKNVEELLIKFCATSEAKQVKKVFVDIHGEGELLKETFDIEMLPSVRLVKGD